MSFWDIIRRSPAAPATHVVSHESGGGDTQRPLPLTRDTQTDHFPRAVAIILRHEGGHVLDPADPGGETKYGISQRAYPDIKIATLTEDVAKGIYKRDYWTPLRCGEMPWPVAICVFDAGVNQGVGRAARFLQEAVRVPADGRIGPVTLAAVQRRDPIPLAQEIQAARILHYASLPGWGRFGRGWARRAMDVMVQAAS